MPDQLNARKAAEEIAKYIRNHTYSAFGNVAGDWEEQGIAAIIERCAGEGDSGAGLIAKERRRQIEKEGFDDEHDANHGDDALAWGAMFYTLPGPFLLCSSFKPKTVLGVVKAEAFFEKTQWASIWAKRDSKTRIQQLTVAGALIAAEIDRLKRKGAEPCPTE